jgi:hypothetical protein
MNDDDDTMNFKSKQLSTNLYTIDENDEEEIVELENNLENKDKLDEEKSEIFESKQMMYNDINVISIIENEEILLFGLENNIMNLENKDKIDYKNESISLLKLEESINFIDKSKYIIDDESDETSNSSNEEIIIEKNDKQLKISNNSLLTNKNFNLLTSNDSNIQIYGCSHCRCFSRKNIKFNSINIFNNFISSASISGIVNDISSLNYKSIITKKILQNPFDYHIFKLGQIDVEYVYYFKTLKKDVKISKDNFFNDIITKYISFLKHFINSYGCKIIICGSNIVNPVNWKNNMKSILGINKLPKDISYKSKNDDILLFNSILKKECLLKDIKYFDTTSKCCKITDEFIFLNKKYIGKDYHYKGAENDDFFNNESKNYGINTYSIFLNALIKNLN